MTVVLEKQRIVLRFQDTVLTTDPYARTVSGKLSLEACAGDLLLFRLARIDQISVFADVCNGMMRPLSGAVYFLGKDWRHLSPDMANAHRGRTGQVFIKGNWIRNLTVMENILVPQLYHTHNSRKRILAEAGNLAENFGLPGLPRELPGDCTDADLQRAACVRAFLGQPLLILLEEPTNGLGHDILVPLIQAIRNARSRGAAVIWMTREKGIFNDATIPATRRYRLAARNLLEVKV